MHHQIRTPDCKPAGAVVIQRRHIPVFLWAEAIKPRFTGMQIKNCHPSGGDLIDENVQSCLFVHIINTNAAFHGHRHSCGLLHRRHTICNKVGFGHQACPKTPRLHTVRRATNIQINFIKPIANGQFGCRRKAFRITAADLQSQRMFCTIMAKQAIKITVQNRLSRYHFGEKQSIRCQQTMEKPAMAVSPIHHRGHRKATFNWVFRICRHVRSV